MAETKRKTTKSTKTTSTATTVNNVKMMLYNTVLIVCITSQFLSVNAIRCHQCNSHLDEDCITLGVNTARTQHDDKFLRECENQYGDQQAFCRKTVLKIETSGEYRIIRGCGWIRDRAQVGNNSCFTADNEGYKQIICACSEDGCNGSSVLGLSKWPVLVLTAVGVALATVFHRN